MVQSALRDKYSPLTTAVLAGTAGLAVAALIAVAGLTMTPQKAAATPALAKGRACTVCHSGMPPTKKNVKKNHPK